jgi:hypothetical protein
MKLGPIAALALAWASTADARPVKVERNTAALEFSYEWPAEAAAIPTLNRRLRSEMEKALLEARKYAREDMSLARADKREFHQHFLEQSWITAGLSPRLLSLEGQVSTFTGGAHPNHGNSALLWDRALARQVSIGALFSRPEDFMTLTRSSYCKALDQERLRRRQGEKLGGEFDKCPPFTDLANAPADRDKDRRFDTIHFVASPYVAGPYVEGEYEVRVPVTRRLIAKLKPEFRASFEAQRQ